MIAFAAAGLLCALASAAETPRAEVVIAKLDSVWQSIHDCRCTMEVYVRAGGKEERHRGEYLFMKPNWIRFRITDGDDAGSDAVFDPEAGVVRARGGGILSIVKVSLPPTNPRVRSIRGHRFDQNNFGRIVERWRYYLACGSAQVEQRGDTIILAGEADDTSRFYGTKRETLYVSAKTFLPCGFDQYDATGVLIRRVRFVDVRVDVGLRRSDFEL